MLLIVDCDRSPQHGIMGVGQPVLLFGDSETKALQQAGFEKK